MEIIFLYCLWVAAMSLPFSSIISQLSSTEDIMSIVAGYNPCGHPIKESQMYIVMQRYAVIRNVMEPIQQRAVEMWIRLMATMQMGYFNTNSSKTNNWLAHQIKTVGVAGAVLSDPIFTSWACQNLNLFIDENLYADGSCLDFKQRDSLTYVTYALRPLVIVIRALNIHDIYFKVGKKGGSIQKSVAFLKPFIKGKMINIMFEKTIYPSDRVIHADHVGKPWPKHDARPLLHQCVLLDPSLDSLLSKIS